MQTENKTTTEQLHPPVVGLTGGIGSGKTTVSDTFADLGITVVDTDVIARQVVEPGTQALTRIAGHFGSDNVLQANGALDRRALREIIFTSPEEKQWLEALLHPLIRKETMRQIQQSQSTYTILVSALLLESGQHQWCQRVLLVDTPEQQQVARTVTRDDSTPEQVESIIRTQMSRKDRLSLVDDIIVNDNSLDALTQAVKLQHKAYLELFNA